jgi:hypothetical protein
VRGRRLKSSTHIDQFSVVLEPPLDDVFRRLAAKNYLSLRHCSKRQDALNDGRHTVAASSTSKAQTSSSKEDVRDNSPPSIRLTRFKVVHFLVVFVLAVVALNRPAPNATIGAAFADNANRRSPLQRSTRPVDVDGDLGHAHRAAPHRRALRWQ